MYIPKHFINDDIAAALNFMKKFNFATLITASSGKPIATHLPFVIESKDEKIILSTHLSKVNPQVKELDGEVLVIFQEPHAYISPSLYSHEKNVPTWNYVAVHCYGISRLQPKDTYLQRMEQFIGAFEPGFFEQWERLPDSYREGLLKGISVIDIEVTDLQAKEKLSQNKSMDERKHITENLRQQADGTKSDLADLMEQRIKRDTTK